MTDPDDKKKEEAAAGEEELPRMTFGEHLEELRRRLFISVVAVVIAFAGCFAFYEPLVYVVAKPHQDAVDMINEGLEPGAPGRVEDSKFLAGNYQGPFFAVIKMSFIVGIFLASPIVAWQAWAFIAAGLYRRERRYVYVFSVPSFLLFVGGCMFGYFILIPYGLWGLTSIQVGDVMEARYIFSDYLGLVLLLTVVMGCVFELPLLMTFFSLVGLVDPAAYSKWRKFAIIGMFLMGAMLTPPDPLTQLMMAGPLILLYELGIVAARMIRRKPPSGEPQNA